MSKFNLTIIGIHDAGKEHLVKAKAAELGATCAPYDSCSFEVIVPNKEAWYAMRDYLCDTPGLDYNLPEQD
ncbi:MAG TPA: hypothetical protein P5291_11105 [Flavobacteriales bacterium]|nr:hypothetical protein [Flavobacteriales bacterium]